VRGFWVVIRGGKGGEGRWGIWGYSLGQGFFINRGLVERHLAGSSRIREGGFWDDERRIRDVRKI